ncbi:MAG TPA: DUF6443 domain-containing protein, partial [Puia sp.]|nr:DUF6443 domain-containing protein [Puia sp.]
MNLYLYIRRSLNLTVLLIGWLQGSTQTISGTTCAASGTAYQYTLSGTWTSSTLTWSATGGTISGSSSGTNLTQITVTWGGSGTGTVSVTTTSPTDNYNLSVTIYAPLTPGAFTAGAGQGIDYNTTPATITCATPTGGYCTASYRYQWWYSTNENNYSLVSGATSLNLSFGSTTLTQTTYYVLEIVDNYTGVVAWSSVAAVYVWPSGQSGIIAGYTCMATGTQDEYTVSCNSCTGSTTMTWSVAGGTISGSSSGSGLFQIPVNWSRTGSDTVKVITASPADTFSLVVSSCPALSAGTITSGGSQAINYNTTPANIVSSGASGGNCFPEYYSQWESSTNGTTWQNISGATSATLNLSATNLTQTTYYVCEVNDPIINTVAYSPIATVTVYPQLVSGTISPASQTIVSGTVPDTLKLGSTSGGSGSYAYQWLSTSPAVGSFTPISGATGSTYTPPALTAQMDYEVITTSNGVSVTSAPAFVAIYPPLAAGAITPGSESLTSGTGPGLLTSTPAQGGNGTYHYQWQNSTNGTTFSNISGDTTLTYNPGTLTATTWYQLAVTSNGQTLYTEAVAMTVSTVNTDLNYIRTRTLSRPGLTDTGTAGGLTSPYDVQQSTTYFDGLGRPIQSVAMQASPLGNDMVTMQAYDGYGREATHYLPYTSPSSNGNYKTDPTSEQGTFNAAQFPSDQYYYGQTAFEPSPLNRVVNAYAPGNSWVGSGRSVSQQYLVNTVSDSVRIWTIAYPVGSIPTSTATYPAGVLYKNVTTDEAGNQTVTYTDMNKQVVLKKVQQATVPGMAHVGWLCTYYVYDDLGFLRFVIQPQAVVLINSSWSISSTIASELCFRYEYDQWGRMNIKKIPGAGEVHMVYDERDRVVMTQDSLLRSSEQWLTTTYDSENRPDSTVLMTDPTNYNNLSYHTAAAMSSPTYPTLSGYTNTLQTQTYYDDYSWVAGSGTTLSSTMTTNYLSNGNDFVTSYNTSPTYAFADTAFMITRGLATGARKLVLGTSQYLYDATFYDDRGRVIQTQSVNYTGGVDTVTNQYDFTGKPLRSMLSHSKQGNTAQYHTVVTKMDYDPFFRLRHIWKNIDGAASDQLIDSMQYNELGQLGAKYLGSNVDSLIYTYNIRGWLSGINPNYVAGTTTHYFGMELGYDRTTSVAPGNTYITPEYNGNIEGTVWKSAGSGLNRKYDFTYDPVNRITGAGFLQNTSGSSWDKNQVDFSVSNLGYDANGNIKTMTQRGFLAGGSQPIDSLTYGYSSNGSNKLLGVLDAENNPTSKLGDFHYAGTKTNDTTDYTYDGDG